MNVDLENLVTLQECDIEIRALESRLKRIPREITNLEEEIATERANVKDAEDRLNEAQRVRRASEGELELLEGKISKYKEQLMQVKTNEEYRAMQKQIQSAKEEVSSKEDIILVKMEEADRLQEELRRRQKELDEGLTRVRKLETELEAEASRLRDELQRKQSEREELQKLLPQDLLGQYGRIAGVRNGIALAEARDEFCQVCHVRQRPQVFEELRLGNSIQRCDNCSRILYIASGEQGSA